MDAAHHWLVGISLGAGALLIGCLGEDARDEDYDGIGSFTAGAEEDTGDDAGQSTGPDRFDLGEEDGTGGTAEGGEGMGCEKVDFVFVIDSSASMADEQKTLLASFPGFIAAIQQSLENDDFHVMVVDAGAIPGSGCDGELGAGRTSSGSGEDCGLVGGSRYATSAQSDLTAAFSCMASRGFDGPGDEQTMDSLLAGIGPLSAPGDCNGGFVRDDAILVVTIITDEEDNSGDINPFPKLDGSCEPADSDPNSAGEPQTWYEQIVDAKLGDPSAVVMLSLIGDCDQNGECGGIIFDPDDPTASDGAEPAPRLRELTNMWDHGNLGPVCAPDYAPFFESAVSVVSQACDDFIPQG